MNNLAKKTLTLFAAAALFCGLSFGQLNCSAGTTGASITINPNEIRAEGNSEQIGDITFTCIVPVGNNPVLANSVMTQLSVTLSPRCHNHECHYWFRKLRL